MSLLAPVARKIDAGFCYHFDERLARYPLPVSDPAGNRKKRKKRIWLHIASVGEIQVAENLINELACRGEFQFFLTVMTEQGLRIAQQKFAERVICLMAPLDIPCLVRRAIDHIRPDVFLCVETELWPALLDGMRRAKVPMALINGRMSSRSFRRYQLVAGLMRRLLAGFQAIVVISPGDGDRFGALGVRKNRIQVSGNSKYSAGTKEPAAMRAHYRQKLNLGSATVFISGSTRSGEEELLLPVYRRLRLLTDNRLVWIIAPRHLQRIRGLQNFFSGRHLATTLFSMCDTDKESADIILVDCMGELADLYAAGDFNFCGGSLVDKGGHNIMEVIYWGLPVYFGPYTQDFTDAVNMVVPAGAGFQAADAEELATLLINHIHDRNRYNQACRAASALRVRQNKAVHEQADTVCRLLQAAQ